MFVAFSARRGAALDRAAERNRRAGRSDSTHLAPEGGSDAQTMCPDALSLSRLSLFSHVRARTYGFRRGHTITLIASNSTHHSHSPDRNRRTGHRPALAQLTASRLPDAVYRTPSTWWPTRRKHTANVTIRSLRALFIKTRSSPCYTRPGGSATRWSDSKRGSSTPWLPSPSARTLSLNVPSR